MSVPVDKTEFSPTLVELQDLASKNTECSVKLEFQINNEELFSISMPYAIFGVYL